MFSHLDFLIRYFVSCWKPGIVGKNQKRWKRLLELDQIGGVIREYFIYTSKVATIWLLNIRRLTNRRPVDWVTHTVKGSRLHERISQSADTSLLKPLNAQHRTTGLLIRPILLHFDHASLFQILRVHCIRTLSIRSRTIVFLKGFVKYKWRIIWSDLYLQNRMCAQAPDRRRKLSVLHVAHAFDFPLDRMAGSKKRTSVWSIIQYHLIRLFSIEHLQNCMSIAALAL